MALYAIGDLHLSLNADKSMEVFGGRWEGYLEKLRRNLSVITDADTTVLMGDLSWAPNADAAREDLALIASIPGRKLLLKGNHDYWWTTAAKFYAVCAENGWQNMQLLHNNCYIYGDYAICGTRGWFFEEEKSGAHDEKVFRRELCRLETSLKAAGDREILCFLHYPPVYRGYTCPEILALLERYGVRRCFYGHLHGDSHKLAIEGKVGITDFRLLSADFLDFKPFCVCADENEKLF